MKFVLVVAVVAAVLWLMFGRGRRAPPQPKPPRAARRVAGPAQMIACAHCGLHLPADEAVQDAQGRSFCSEAHRLAGPR